jgi:hypothetical protein
MPNGIKYALSLNPIQENPKPLGKNKLDLL